MTSAGEQLLAHNLALVAIPALLPALVVVGMVLYIARKDRRDEQEERELIERAFDQEDNE